MSTGFDEGDPWLTEGAAYPEQTAAAIEPQDEAPFVAPSFETAEDERQAIWATLRTLDTTMSGFQQSQAQIAASLAGITSLLRSQSQAQPAPPPPVQPAPPPAVAPALPHGTPRFKEPFVFGGSAAEVEPWIDEITNAVFLQSATLPDDYRRSLYLAGYLKQGSPKSWYYGVKASSPHLLSDFSALLDNFRSHFGDSDLSATSLRKLKELKQTGSCASYASKSRELHQHLSINDFTKCDMFYEGLKESVKDVLINIKRSHNFDIFVEQCTEIDNRLHAREVEKRAANKSAPRTDKSAPRPQARAPAPTPAPAPAPTVAPAASGVIPMEIDAVRRGPLSTAEKERRRKEGLCLYCGQGQHTISNCPNMSAKAKAASKTNAAPSGKV